MCDTQDKKDTTTTGGWCADVLKTGHITDDKLAQWMANFFTGQSVVGLGDGLGAYRRLILGAGRVQRYDAFDGTPNISNITGGQVRSSYTHFYQGSDATNSLFIHFISTP